MHGHLVYCTVFISSYRTVINLCVLFSWTIKDAEPQHRCQFSAVQLCLCPNITLEHFMWSMKPSRLASPVVAHRDCAWRHLEIWSAMKMLLHWVSSVSITCSASSVLARFIFKIDYSITSSVCLQFARDDRVLNCYGCFFWPNRRFSPLRSS